VVPRIALGREAPPIPVASPAAGTESRDPVTPAEVHAPAPVLEYRTPVPPGRKPKEVAASSGNAKTWLAAVVVLGFAVRAWVAMDRQSSRTPPPAPRPLNIPQRPINLNPQAGPGAMGPAGAPGGWAAPGGAVRTPGANDFYGRVPGGGPYSVDPRGRLVDRYGAPVNPEPPGPTGPVGPP